jgi:hypothetical protein
MDPAGGNRSGGAISGGSHWALNTRIEDIAAGKVTLVG